MKRGALLVILVASLILYTGLAAYWTAGNSIQARDGELPSFGSYAELARYLDAAGQVSGDSSHAAYYGPMPPTPRAPSPALPAGSSSGVPYSTTNVQVSGIDELDRVKTDGTYLYVASADTVAIIRAYPPSAMAVVARISMGNSGGGTYPTVGHVVGLFLNEGRLAVLFASYAGIGYTTPAQPSTALRPSIAPTFLQSVKVSIYDLTRIDEPRLLYTQSVSGSPLSARMANAIVYVIAGDYIQREGLQFPKPALASRMNDGAWTYHLPTTCAGDRCSSLDVGSIHYDPENTQASSFTNLLAVDSGTGNSKTTSVITGPASIVYMSPAALYLAFPKWGGDVFPAGGPRLLGPVVQGPRTVPSTTLYKLLAEGINVRVVARGDVEGTPLNQFAFDERGGYLRIATMVASLGLGSPSVSNVYVLDGNLRVTGGLKGLAPGERIFAARYVGELLYLVTFRQVDPLFVIDLANPNQPKVLGELKVLGLSNYLQPVDKDHLLGIGWENHTVKVSLFDVSDSTNPVEASKFSVGVPSGSPAEWDHHAVLFDGSMGLLVIPVDIWGYGAPASSSPKPVAATTGAYVFKVAAGSGISLRGIISHQGGAEIQRSLYIGEYLYTISNALVKSNALGDLSEVNSVAYGPAVVYAGFVG